MAYVYENKILHINRHRRKEDGSPYVNGSSGVDNDRRRKIKDGIILIEFDRRQNHDPYYSGPERRNGTERRSGMDRRIGANIRQYAC